MDKTWYITGAEINSTRINGSEVKELYANPYSINFSSSTFTGTLYKGCVFSGYWSADGKSRDMKLKINQETMDNATVLSRNIYRIISGATRYSGDSNVLKIYKDSNNFIELNRVRN